MPERIRILHGITTAMLRILELDRLLPEIVRSATLLESADAASVMLVDESGEFLRIVAHHGLSEQYATAQRIPMETAKSIYRGFDTHIEIDLEKQPAGDPALIKREGLARVVAMPLVHEGKLIGGINVYTRDEERRFDDIDLDILHILAAQASIAITNARLYEAERHGRRVQESLLAEQQESERQKDEFLSIVSHELKTPLTPLKALAQLLRLRLRRHREDGRELDLDSLDSNLRTIERQVDRMSGLVNDLLEVSRAGQGRFELQQQEFDLIPVVHEVVQRYREISAEEGRITFAVKAPGALRITGDAMRIEQALANLIGNAVKYSPSGGEIRVAVEERGDEVALIVADDGIGIPPEDLPTLARPFARGSRRARTFSGMGIGLYLARLVAEGHGGSIALASPGEDRGTTVTVRLPRSGSAS
ncbi:MAG TPA: GAF domain-containing sensor histidine kinase [Patescibacteria group bacterium]|jgi:signal transduction histidine kinase|nr:GAF domain-containing sensor histidine kinase [Patescibacteria group bacterium]